MRVSTYSDLVVESRYQTGLDLKEELMRRKRALLLEDNTAIRFALKQLLDKLGFEVLDFPAPGSCPHPSPW